MQDDVEVNYEPQEIDERSLFSGCITENSCNVTIRYCRVRRACHMYSMLGIYKYIKESESDTGKRMMRRIVEDYLDAARAAVKEYKAGYIGEYDVYDSNANRAMILEVQGEVIHFLFKPTGIERAGYDFSRDIIRFARILNKHVGNVKSKYGLKIFKMAASCGASVVLIKTSRSNEASANSYISIGRCANNPAKQLYRDGAIETGCVAVQLDDTNSSTGGWQKHNAKVQPTNENFRGVEFSSRPSERTIVLDHACRLKDKAERVDNESYDTMEVRKAFMFRADMDGFTKLVQKTFDNDGNSEAMRELMVEFTAILTTVDTFITGKDKVDMVMLPWEGDCVSFIITPPARKGSECTPSEEKAFRLMAPIYAKTEWDIYMEKKIRPALNAAKQRIRDAHPRYVTVLEDDSIGWVESASYGTTWIAELAIDSNHHQYVALGVPAEHSKLGVNHDETKRGMLVMHKDDVSCLCPRHKELFSDFANGPDDYRFMRGDALNRCERVHRGADIAKAASASAATKFMGATVRPSRPFGG